MEQGIFQGCYRKKRLSFITQFKTEFLLLFTGCRKVPGKMPDQHHQLLIHDFMVRLIFWKHCRENLSIYPFITLCWVNEDENMQPNKFFQPCRTLYIAQLLKTNLLFQTSLSGPTGINLFKFCCNNNSIMCEICSKLTIEAPHIFEYIYF